MTERLFGKLQNERSAVKPVTQLTPCRRRQRHNAAMLTQLFDPDSSTYTYVLADTESREAVIIDPVLEQAGRDMALIARHELTLRWVLDTHVHADHVTGADALKQVFGAH